MRKAQKTIANRIRETIYGKSEDAIIAEIHREFDEAEDNILSAADKVLEELKIPTQSQIKKRAKALIKIGFTQAAPVKQYEKMLLEEIKIKEELSIAKERAALIRQYKQDYPFQKFLTEMELNRICDKYGLVYAPVSAYIKDVPEKNLAEIKKAKPLSDDLLVRQQYVLEIIRFSSGVNDKIREFLLDGGIELSKEAQGMSNWRRNSEVNDCLRVFLQNAGFKEVPSTIVDECSVKTLDKQGLFIAAPKSNFNLDDMQAKGKHGYFEVKSTVKIEKDPIVFRYCKGGIQVLSKWGLEASDPAVINELEN